MLLYLPSLPLFPLLKWGQLNQTLGSLAGHAAKTRRLQQTLTLAPMPEGCPAACDGIQCAYDDSQAIINRMNAGSDMTWPCHFEKMSEHVGAKLWSLSAVCCSLFSRATRRLIPSTLLLQHWKKWGTTILVKARFSNLEGLCGIVLVSPGLFGMIWQWLRKCDSI